MTTTTGSPPETAAEPTGLRANALGFPTVLAQSIALISPTMTAVLIIPLAFADAGQGTWLTYLFGTVMLLFVVACLNQFARRSACPGSMYSYTGRGLGPTAGVFSGWTLIWSYLFIGVAGLAGFAVFAQQLLDAVGIHVTVAPILLFAISAAACWFIAYKDIRVSSILMLFIEALSVACILALACVVLFKHGFSVDTNQLTLKGMTAPRTQPGVVICIFSLVGFESATALGGEAKNPLRNVPRAVPLQPDHRRGVLRVHELRRGLRHPATTRRRSAPSPPRSTSCPTSTACRSSRCRCRCAPWSASSR